MKLNRNLNPGILEHYSALLEEGKLREKLGSHHVISFTGEHVLKSPINNNPEEYDKFRKSLFKEFKMGIKLEEIGLNVPKVIGAYLEKKEIPFLVIETKDLTNYTDLTNAEQTEFDKQYDEQIQLAIKHNFTPDDICKTFNCGFDRKNQKITFYDFEHWRSN